MSGLKHLWSGDWQEESQALSEELADRRVNPRDPEPAASSPPHPRTRRREGQVPRRPGWRRALPIALAAVLLLGAGAWGLTALLGSSGPRASTIAGGSSGPPAATGPAVRAASTPSIAPSRPVHWLGMQIETVPPGAAVIATVGPRSLGDLAGLSPGDVIIEVNHRAIHGTSDIAPAIRGLHAGDQVEIQISHGSALYETEATLAAPPSVYP
jgi:membrane-associated protease RseP (regulator of RpoE activity)